MAKKTALPLTKELMKQVSEKEYSAKSKEDYIRSRQVFESLDAREQERTETLYRLRQIENLLLMIYEKS